jgi:hypothetical protein
MDPCDSATVRQRMAARGYNAALSMLGPISLDAWAVGYPTACRWTELDPARVTDAASIPAGSAMRAMVWTFCTATQAEIAETYERARWGTCQVGQRAAADRIADEKIRETGEPWFVVPSQAYGGWFQIIPQRHLTDDQRALALYVGQP